MSTFARDTVESLVIGPSRLATYQHCVILRSPFPSHQSKSQQRPEGVERRSVETVDATEETASQPSGIETLSTEILLNVISFIDDIPSVVLFALTTKRHYALTLGYFEVRHLNQLCPKDVRSRLPPKLEPFAYNTLQCKCPWSTRWLMHNYCCPSIAWSDSIWPGFYLLDVYYQACVLSFIRQIKLAESPGNKDGFIPNYSAMGEYVTVRGVRTVRVRAQDVRKNLNSRQVMPIVEYLVLRGLLEEWCQNVEGYGSGPWRPQPLLIWVMVLLGLALAWCWG